jgi:LacI family transcriptional regulator
MVNEATARKVLEAALALDYRPNRMARGLRTNRSFTVGVVIPDITNPLFPPIVRGIEDVLGEAGYTALVANSDNDPERERLHFESLRARQVEGFLMATAQRDYPLSREASRAGVPMVLINRTTERKAVSSVVGDDRQGIRLAVDHLASLGHTRIAHVAGPQAVSTGFGRHRAFLDSMRAGGLKPDPRLIAMGSWFTEAEGASAFGRLLETKRSFTAVVAGNDLMALGCYDVLAETGMRCPEDVSIVGFNDMPFLDKLRPPLTTIRIPHYEIGARAARLLLERLENPELPPERVLLRCELVVRGSTAAPAGRPARSRSSRTSARVTERRAPPTRGPRSGGIPARSGGGVRSRSP